MAIEYYALVSPIQNLDWVNTLPEPDKTAFNNAFEAQEQMVASAVSAGLLTISYSDNGTKTTFRWIDQASSDAHPDNSTYIQYMNRWASETGGTFTISGPTTV